ncbi:hypothetical protein RJZ57_003270 [Blastomyces gilchristii]
MMKVEELDRRARSVGKNFIFWLGAISIADRAFKGICTVQELLSKRPPKGRESWTLEWEDSMKNVPVLCMVTAAGPNSYRGMTFSFNTSEASRSQALYHEDPNTYLKYQSKVLALDIQACFWGLAPDHEVLEMEQSMAHYRDTNVPQHLDAEVIVELERDAEMIDINFKITELTKKIGKHPRDHEDLVREQAKLYNKALKMRRQKL